MPHKGLRGQLNPMPVGLSGYGCRYSVPPWMQPEILLTTPSDEWNGLVVVKGSMLWQGTDNVALALCLLEAWPGCRNKKDAVTTTDLFLGDRVSAPKASQKQADAFKRKTVR